MLPSQVIIWQDPASSHRFCDRDFDMSYWAAQATARKLSGGRGASRVICLQERAYVLRHYLRGGWIAKLLHDQYLWTGSASTRPSREQQVIDRALSQGLPVPRVAAYRVIRSGILYRADIISEYLEHQGTLATCLGTSPLDPALWRSLGQLVHRMHDAGIYHADLNATNLLIDQHMGFHLIDFDKAVIQQDRTDLGQKNLQRLHRSLTKIKRQQEEKRLPFHFAESDWRTLVDAYQST